MENFVWIICYVDLTELHTIEKQLAKKYTRYSKVEVFIPTVNVLEKTFKKTDKFKKVPLLLNYGFFKVPEHFIYNEELLRILKRDVRAIYQWVRDPVKEKLKAKKRRKIPTVAVAKNSEIESLQETCKALGTYSQKDVDNLSVGQKLILRTYPFENIPVTIKVIDYKRKKAEVEITTPMNLTQIVKISFDHLFYTAYHELLNDYVTRETSLDELSERGHNLDQLYFDSYELE